MIAATNNKLGRQNPSTQVRRYGVSLAINYGEQQRRTMKNTQAQIVLKAVRRFQGPKRKEKHK